MNELAKKIEALLFVAGEGNTLHAFAAQLKKTETEIIEAVSTLKEHLETEHYLTVLEHEGKISIVTASDVAPLVEDFAKEEFTHELTRAALETLAIIAYKGPIRRVDIDYIRGVNSSFMIRNLMMRGLIERMRDSKDSRAFAYRISLEFLKFMGLTSLADLPDYGSFAQKLEEFIAEADESHTVLL